MRDGWREVEFRNLRCTKVCKKSFIRPVRLKKGNFCPHQYRSQCHIRGGKRQPLQVMDKGISMQ